jgi:hypothetical protein
LRTTYALLRKAGDGAGNGLGLGDGNAGVEGSGEMGRLLGEGDAFGEGDALGEGDAFGEAVGEPFEESFGTVPTLSLGKSSGIVGDSDNPCDADAACEAAGSAQSKRAMAAGIGIGIKII